MLSVHLSIQQDAVLHPGEVQMVLRAHSALGRRIRK